MTEDEVVTEFQRKRGRANKFGWPPFAIGFAAFAWSANAASKGTWPRLSPVAFFGGMALLIFGILMVAANVRCPLCNQMPMGSMGGGKKGLILNPDSCPTCGARLR